MVIRRGLHALGLRYRLHDRRLPGTPDLVFRKAQAVIFVHGCFWHGHDCPLGVRPGSNTGFWEEKIGRNQRRDDAAEADLIAAGWRVGTVWECALRGRIKLPLADVLNQLGAFVRRGDCRRLQVLGAENPEASVGPDA
jgi:DNA mismatch endonuclease (patch repair protein)